MNDPVNVLLDDAQRKLVEAHYALLRLIPPHGTLEGALRAAERDREELLRLRARNDELERRLAAWVRGGEVPPVDIALKKIDERDKEITRLRAMNAEMLEALRKLHGSVQKMLDANEETPRDVRAVLLDDICEALSSADAIIAKAEAQEQKVSKETGGAK